MSSSSKSHPSEIVKTVLALDETFEEMKRLSKRIENLEIRGDADYEHLRDFLTRYARSAESITTHVSAFSNALKAARADAEQAAIVVGERAEFLQEQHEARVAKTEAFEALSRKVGELTGSLQGLHGTGQKSEADRVALAQKLKTVGELIQPLIIEAQTLREEAQAAKMTALEQEANSLRQSLIEVRKRLSAQ